MTLMMTIVVTYPFNNLNKK